MDTYLICTDCTFIIANDDDSGIADPDAHRERMEATMAGYGSAPGMWWVVTGDEPIAFSTAPCDTCGTWLAGERHTAVLM